MGKKICIDDTVTFISQAGPHKCMKISATVKDIIGDVAMICPWNCGHEIIKKLDQLKFVRKANGVIYAEQTWESHFYQ